ncbi:MAG: RND family transporter, partial [Zoogloea sp.]|nr:RND family transporter [Zoogloea sp.]
MAVSPNAPEMAVIRDPKDFDMRSGGLLEQLIFNNRLLLIIACVLLTVFFGYHTKDLKVGASYDKMLPQSHPYIQNYLENRVELRGLGDSVRIVVAARDGDIFNAA